MNGSLEHCERDVEAARAKLAVDLQLLRQPETVRSFTRAIKIELMTAKAAAVESAKTSASDAMRDAIDKLKSKAAENPAALLAIGAGLAWHFVRNPPVASALMGAGLFSLLKTSAPAVPPKDLIGQGRERLKEQVGELAELATATAQSASATVTQKVSEATRAGLQGASNLADRMTEQAARVTDHVAEQINEHATRANERIADQLTNAASWGKEAVGEVAAQVRRTRHDVGDRIMEGVDMTTDAIQHAVTPDQHGDTPTLVPSTPRTQDAVLLGIAGVAVAAALGIALQRSASEA